MKKIHILGALLLGALLTISCKQEAVPAPETDKTVTIRAVLDPETRTFYENEKYFSWVEGDNVSLMVVNDETGVPDVIRLTAQSTGPVTDLTGDGVEGWTPGDYAFYPKDTKDASYSFVCSDLEKYVDTENKVMNLRLYGTINGNLGDPLSVVPMIGKRTEDNTFAFKTATGILKFTVENIPADTYYFSLDHTEDVPLNGYFSFGEDCTLYMENAIQGWAQKYVYFTPAEEGETRDFYLPIPVGTIPAGLEISVSTFSRGKITLATTTEPIEVVRNRVLRTPKLTVPAPPVEEWVSIGTGKFIDNYIWPFAGLTDYVDVEFQQSSLSETKFRIAKPYPGPEADEWFCFDVADPTKVTSDDYFTDVTITKGDVSFKPYVRNGHDYGYNFSSVLKTQENGLPANIQIGPCYRGAEFDTAENPYAYEVGKDHEELVIEIVFPGCKPYEKEYEPGQIALTTDNVTASDVCTHDGGGLPALLDGNPATYWHSNWYYAVTGNDPVYGIYFDITLEEPVTKFHFEYLVRDANANAAPTAMVIGVSNDGTAWTQLGKTISTEAMTGAGAGARVALPIVDAGAAYKYVRLGITDSKNGDEGSLTGDLNWNGYKKCTNLAELMLFRD